MGVDTLLGGRAPGIAVIQPREDPGTFQGFLAELEIQV